LEKRKGSGFSKAQPRFLPLADVFVLGGMAIDLHFAKS
jgi:hypothetical protein